MDTITATTPVELDSVRKFSQLDINCINMVIKGQWLFNGIGDPGEMQKSLRSLLNYYPHLSGRMLADGSGILMNNKGVPFHVKDMPTLKAGDIHTIKKPLDHFNLGLDLTGFKEGKIAPLCIQLTRLADGHILNIHCAHICMDGEAFFKMLSDWSKLHNGQPVVQPVFTEIPEEFSPGYSQQEALNKTIQKKWKKVGFTNLLQLMRQKITRASDITSQPLYISESQIGALYQKIEKENGFRPGRNAALSALATKICYRLNGFKSSKKFSQISVISLRGRMPGILIK